MFAVVNGNFNDVKIMIDTCMIRESVLGKAMHKSYKLFHFPYSASSFIEKHSAFMLLRIHLHFASICLFEVLSQEN